MTRRNWQRRWTAWAIGLTFVAGAASGWKLHDAYAGRDADGTAAATSPVATISAPIGRDVSDAGTISAPGPAIGSGTISADVPRDLLAKALPLPIDDADVDALKGHFAQRRGGGTRGHEAVDILAPRNTPVRAVENGTIARLFLSRQGGITIYQFDPSGRYCYYYAHLERYAAGLREGQHVAQGEVIGYVGTSGNAPPDTPHLHFAIVALTPEKHWWEGTPLDPYLVFRR